MIIEIPDECQINAYWKCLRCGHINRIEGEKGSAECPQPYVCQNESCERLGAYQLVIVEINYPDTPFEKCPNEPE